MADMRAAEIDFDTAIDTASFARAALGRANRKAADLRRAFGGSPSYWSVRLNGHKGMSQADIECIAALTGVHPAELMGGEAPAGWTPPEPPQRPERDSNARPTAYYAAPLQLVTDRFTPHLAPVVPIAA